MENAEPTIDREGTNVTTIRRKKIVRKKKKVKRTRVHQDDAPDSNEDYIQDETADKDPKPDSPKGAPKTLTANPSVSSSVVPTPIPVPELSSGATSEPIVKAVPPQKPTRPAKEEGIVVPVLSKAAVGGIKNVSKSGEGLADRERIRDERAKRAVEQKKKVDQNLPNCCSCRTAILSDAEFVEAFGKKWHDFCFCCSSCSERLDKSFVNIGEKPMCKKCDTDRRLGGKCCVCSKSIDSEYFDVTGDFEAVGVVKVIHPHCFQCVNCKKQLSPTGEYSDRDGKYRCIECDPHSRITCGICSKGIPPRDDFMHLSDVPYHMACLNCAACSKPLQVVTGFVEGGDKKFYCAEGCVPDNVKTSKSTPIKSIRTGEVMGAICSACNQAFFQAETMIENVFPGDNRKWHITCFACELCYELLDRDEHTSYSLLPGAKIACMNCQEICPACHRMVGLFGDGTVVNSLGKSWHSECFICSKCNAELAGECIEYDGKPICLNCEPAVLANRAPKCGFCDEPVVSESLTALGKTWHKNCFKCSNCAVGLGGGFHRSNDNKQLCGRCFDTQSTDNCTACKQPIIGSNKLRAFGKAFHSDCFKCRDCQCSLSEGCLEKNGLPICEPCFNLSSCGECGQDLEGERISAGGKKFHVACFVCYCCKGSLSGGFKVQEGHFCCGECLKKKRSPAVICAGCHQSLGEDFMTALNKRWHKPCFKCITCSAVLNQDFHSREGNQMCDACFKRSVDIQPTNDCPRCKKPLEGKVVRALEQRWHQDCFVCARCSKGLTDFIEYQRMPHCIDCFRIIGPRKTKQPTDSDLCQPCYKCGMALESRRIDVAGRRYHPECFVCAGCKVELKSTDYVEKDGMAHCGCLAK